MINALQELSKAPGGKTFNRLAPSISSFLLSCYKDDGKAHNMSFIYLFSLVFSFCSCSLDTSMCINSLHANLITGSEEVKLVILLALASWLLRSAEAVRPDVVSFIASGLREKETLRKGHLKCLRLVCKNADSLTRVTRV